MAAFSIILLVIGVSCAVVRWTSPKRRTGAELAVIAVAFIGVGACVNLAQYSHTEGLDEIAVPMFVYSAGLLCVSADGDLFSDSIEVVHLFRRKSNGDSQQPEVERPGRKWIILAVRLILAAGAYMFGAAAVYVLLISREITSR